jgi:hypothetical protein
MTPDPPPEPGSIADQRRERHRQIMRDWLSYARAELRGEPIPPPGQLLDQPDDA